MTIWKSFVRAFLIFTNIRKLGESIKRPTSTTYYKPEELIKPKTSVSSRFEMLMSEVALIQERISNMAISLSALAEQVGRVASTQVMAVEKINKLTSDMAEISKLLDEKTAAAETSIDVNELNALVEKLKLSTDELTKVVTNP